MTVVIELLEKAKALIGNPDNFTTGVWARNIEGVGIRPESPNAVCFCTLGALRRIERDTKAGEETLYQAEVELSQYTNAYNLPIPIFNDDHGHTAVMNMFNYTINRLKSVESNG